MAYHPPHTLCAYSSLPIAGGLSRALLPRVGTY